MKLPERAPFDGELTRACGAGGLTEAGSAAIERAPYLQKVQARSASLMWTTRTDIGGSVEVTAAGGDPMGTPAKLQADASSGDRFQYAADLDLLEPDTVYCYEIRSPDGVVLASAGFRTAPPSGSKQPVRFVALGDSGARSPDQEAVIDAMRSLPFSLMVNTGDLAGDDGTLAEFEETLFEPYESMMDRVPLFAAIGNHEYGTPNALPFRQVLAKVGGAEGTADVDLWYSFDWGDIHWVILDTNRMVPAQTEWLSADLSANQLPWTIVVLHHPPYSSGHHGSNAAVREAMVPIFEQHRVPLVLVGHDHHYERTRPINGVTYLVTGGGGRGTRPVGTSEFTAFSERVAHFVYGQVSGKELTLHAIDATGALFDSARIRLDR